MAGVPTFPRARRLSWAELMRRVFLADILVCPACAGPMRLLAAIDQPETITRILAHLSLPPRVPPLAPARSDASLDIDPG